MQILFRKRCTAARVSTCMYQLRATDKHNLDFYRHVKLEKKKSQTIYSLIHWFKCNKLINFSNENLNLKKKMVTVDFE